MKIVLRRVCAMILFATMIVGPLSACSSATKTTAAAGLDDSVHSLAAGGIAVVDGVGSRTPVAALSGTPSAMIFTRWQVQNMVAEANAHSGYLGGELDALATPPPGIPPLTTLIVAWLTRHDGALAQYAASFMTGQDLKDPATTVFPTLVVLSFIGDIARVTPATSFTRPPAIDFERLFASPADAQAGGTCTDVSNFVSKTVTDVTNAIQSNGSGWLSSLWNTVVTLAGAALTTAVKTALGPLLVLITKIATICATIMQVSSMFKPWSVALAGNPSSILLSDTAQSGTFVATLSAKDIPWPSELVSCVHEIAPNTTLDDASYRGARVKWTQPVGIPGLATKVSEDDKMPDTKVAQYAFSTSTVPKLGSDECPVLRNAGKIGITVTVERSDITKALKSLESLITVELPSALQPYLQKYIDSALSDVNSTFETFGAPHQSTVVGLTEYFADVIPSCTSPMPSASPTNTPPSRSGSMPFVPCEQLMTESDTAPFMDGAHVMSATGALKKMTTFMEQITGINGHIADTYDHTRSTFCVIGTGTPPPDPQLDSNGNEIPQPPSDFKFAAFFYTVPRGSIPMPDMTPLPESAASDPASCNAIVGIATLNRLHARCVDDGAVSLVIDGPEAEYIMSGMPSGSAAGPQFLNIPPDGMLKAMAHRLQRL